MKLPEGLSRTVATSVLKAKKNSPHIFFGVGVAGILGSTFLACRATLKLEETVDEIKNDLDKVHSIKSVTSQREYNQQLITAYLKAAKEIGILYGPAAILGGLSIASITNSHIQLTKRNAGLAAAYAGLHKTLEEYRERVRAEVGEEKERDIYLAAREQVIDEEGKKIAVKIAEGLPNATARFFDKNNPNWEPQADYNWAFLRAQQQYANDKLIADGYVMLNDVYDWLGFDRTSEGQLLGWYKNNPNGSGYISYGLDDALNVRKQNTVEWSALLDFNVEGIVYNMI